MVIPKAGQDETLQSESFRLTQQAFIALKQQYETVDTLSMGMSADMAAAIAYGSTMVRIGTAIFGKRL